MLGKYSITHLLIYKSILVERIRERGKNIKKQIQIISKIAKVHVKYSLILLSKAK